MSSMRGCADRWNGMRVGGDQLMFSVLKERVLLNCKVILPSISIHSREELFTGTSYTSWCGGPDCDPPPYLGLSSDLKS